MSVLRGGLILSSALAAIGLSAAAQAAESDVTTERRISSSVVSFKDLRDQNVVRQQTDFSCGAAALATILNYEFGENVTEQEILDQLFELLPDEEEAQRTDEGFSLLDLQQVARARGYRAEGFRIEPQFLSQLSGPVIVFIEPRGYNHFAVLKGVQEDRVFLADPSRGNVRLPGYAFLESWLQDDGMGIIFVVEPEEGITETEGPRPLAVDGLSQPELMSAREMLAIGNPLSRLPNLSR